MNITEIISVSPVNPAHGRHEVHAKTAESVDIAFQISPDALGCLTGYFTTFPIKDDAYELFKADLNKPAPTSPKKKGS